MMQLVIEGDLSNVHSIKEFADEMKEAAKECFRVLKPNQFCPILFGDPGVTQTEII